MVIKCTTFENLKQEIVSKNKTLVLFGCGAIGQISTIRILDELCMLDRIDCYIDNDSSKWGGTIEVGDREFLIRSPEYLNVCNDNIVVLLNISRFYDVIEQLKTVERTGPMECYIMPMMLIHNYCSSVSGGRPERTQTPLIPKKLHYMWLGRNPLPDSLKKCIDSWKRYCPDYEIIEWNEDNYDIEKHPYMKQAYDAKAYGFVPDYARLDILYNEGGFYLDTDVEIKRNIDDLCYQESFCGVEKWQIINFGGMSGAIKGHPMIKKFLNARESIFFVDENGKQNRNTCGFYDTKVAIDSGYKINGQTQCICGMNIYAYDYFHPYDYMSGTVKETENTHSIHWFNGGWLDEKMKMANEQTKQQYLDLYNNALSIV